MSRPSDPSGAGLPGGYQPLSFLGRGAYGEVWRAEAPGGVHVAVKIIPRTIRPQEAQRELEALQLIRALRHPYLLSLQAYFALPDQLVIVTELADGNLRQRLQECRDAGQEGIPAAELVGYIKEAAEALDYLNAHDVQHRDVKPDNLLLLGRHVKVADCGLARLQEEHTQQPVTAVGTPAYMAPEVWEGKVTRHSDQYGLAVTYVELRLGRLPFPANTLSGLIRCHLSEQPDLAPLPDGEQEVLRRALAKATGERYPSCSAFVEALAAVLARDGTPALPGAAPPPTLRRDSREGTAATPFSAGPVATADRTIGTPEAGEALRPVAAAFSEGGAAPPAAPPTVASSVAVARTTVDDGARDRGGWRGDRLPARRRPRWVLAMIGCLLAGAVGLVAWRLLPPTPRESSPAENVDGPAVAQTGETRPAESVSPAGAPPTRPAPVASLKLWPLAPVTVEAGKSGTLEARVRRENCTGPVRLAVEGLPTGVRAAPATIAGDADTARIDLTVAEDAAEGEKDVTVRAELDALTAEQTARVAVTVTPALRLLPLPDVTLRPGLVRAVGVKVQRRKCPGPVELRLEGLPEGVTSARVTVVATRDTATVKVIAGKNAGLGTATVRVAAAAGDVRAEGELRLTVGPPRSNEERLAEDTEAIRLRPEDPIAYQNRGLTYAEARDFDTAIKDFDEAIRLDPNSAEAFIDRGNAYVGKKEYDKAIKDFDEAIRLDPGNARAYRNRGLAHGRKGDDDKAIADCSEAIRLEPGYALAYHSRGAAYARKKEYDKAIEDYTAAIRLDPNYVLAYRNRANAYEAKGDRDRARADRETAVRLESSPGKPSPP